MAPCDMQDNLVCRDLSGPLAVEPGPDGRPRCVKTLTAAAATPGYRQEAERLCRAAGGWAAPLVGGTQTRLVFACDEWEPFCRWRPTAARQGHILLEGCLRVARDLCAVLQEARAAAGSALEMHSGVVLVSEAHSPSCRLVLLPAVKSFRPSAYLCCSPEVLLCTPPEALCGQAGREPETYAAGVMLRLLFAEAPEPAQPAAELVEEIVGAGVPIAPTLAAGLPPGVAYAVRGEWEELSGLIARATARRPGGRDVTLDMLADACQQLQSRLDYWKLADDLCAEGRYEEACQVCRYGAAARQSDSFWRAALKRRCADVLMEHLHRYWDAAAIFRDLVLNEAQPGSPVAAQTKEAYGDALAALGPYTLAVTQYERALADIPDRARLLLKIAAAHRDHGSLPATRAALLRLLNFFPDHVEALRDLADLSLRQGDAASAQQQAACALAVLAAQEQHQAAGEQDTDGLRADLHALLGWCWLLRGDRESAEALAGQALDEDPACYRAHNVFALAYLREGDLVRAMRSLNRSLLLRPHQPEIERWLEEAGRSAGSRRVSR